MISITYIKTLMLIPLLQDIGNYICASHDDSPSFKISSSSHKNILKVNDLDYLNSNFAVSSIVARHTKLDLLLK